MKSTQQEDKQHWRKKMRTEGLLYKYITIYIKPGDKI